jgi:hypothetical protein
MGRIKAALLFCCCWSKQHQVLLNIAINRGTNLLFTTSHAAAVLSPLMPFPQAPSAAAANAAKGVLLVTYAVTSLSRCYVTCLQADIAHDHKAAQLEDNVNTLLGLDNNRLCRWDLRDPRGVVQVRQQQQQQQQGQVPAQLWQQQQL